MHIVTGPRLRPVAAGQPLPHPARRGIVPADLKRRGGHLADDAVARAVHRQRRQLHPQGIKIQPVRRSGLIGHAGGFHQNKRRAEFQGAFVVGGGAVIVVEPVGHDMAVGHAFQAVTGRAVGTVNCPGDEAVEKMEAAVPMALRFEQPKGIALGALQG
ncbi:hypothetical protein [Sodalis ligni]|uniref:hypothetical protein n=1 Tax=Sodalis ligni TaxID=2697027 RepID=UPI00104E37EF|nr:hypothetical protein [Sodalis ligni]